MSDKDTKTTEPAGDGGKTTASTDGKTAATQGDPAATDKPLGEAGERALKAEREARAAAEKSAADLKRQLDAVNAANMTDLEKAQKEANDYKAAAEKAAADALRFRIAARHQISDENAELILTGPDEATMERQAALWAANVSTANQAGPRADLTQGGTGDPAALNGDPLLDTLKDKLGIS